jgi:hypothetical protein
VRFDLSNGTKEVSLTLGYEFVTDLPGTKEFKSALWLYLSAMALKWTERSFVEYMTLSGIPLTFGIEFPFARSTEGGDFKFVHVHTKTGIDTVFESNFSVHLTNTIAANLLSLEFIVTEPLVINAVRRFVDAKQAVFYPEGEHPVNLQVLTIESSDYDYKARRFVFQKATDEEIADFLRRKVYWLGFRRGNQATRMYIADSYDAEYLGVSSDRLQQIGAILAAKGFIQLDSSGVYASAGTKLLLEAHNLDRERAALFGATPSAPETASNEAVPPFDVFISHATEDKNYVEPLVTALEAAGIRVWFDKTNLEWGDDLRTAIDRGLTACRYGIVVFSKAFLGKKKWTEYELNSLFAREQAGKKLILPIWHGITREDLIQYSPAFADRFAKLSPTHSYADIVGSVLALLGRPIQRRPDEGSDATVIRKMPNNVKPYQEALGKHGELFISRLSTIGKRLMRHLLQNEPLEVGRKFMIDISEDDQFKQLTIAMEMGIIRHREVRAGSGMLVRTDYEINPQYRPVLEDLLYTNVR